MMVVSSRGAVPWRNVETPNGRLARSISCSTLSPRGTRLRKTACSFAMSIGSRYTLAEDVANSKINICFSGLNNVNVVATHQSCGLITIIKMPSALGERVPLWTSPERAVEQALSPCQGSCYPQLQPRAYALG